MTMLKSFLRDDQGQDILEYMLLLGFLIAAAGAVYLELSGTNTRQWIMTHAQSSQ